MSERLLVTGGAGYVGSHTVHVLLEAGYSVDVLDNLQTGHAHAVPDGAELILCDLQDAERVDRVVARGRYDGILHFAANSLAGESMENPFRYLGDNVTGGLNLVRAASEHGVAKFVFSSTANLFGTAPEGKIDERAEIAPGSPYGESKFIIERLLCWAERIYGMRYATLRYFNAAGADPSGARGEDHRPETHLIPIILQVALGQRSQIEIFGDSYDTRDGTCVRDYVHVLDLARAHLLCLPALDRTSLCYNLGTGQGFTVTETIDMARRVTGGKIPTVMCAPRKGDVASLVACADGIRSDLGWAPEFGSLETIIETAWNWHRSHPHGFQQ